MQFLLRLYFLLAIGLSAVAAEPLPLITKLGDHTLAEGLRLIVRERGADPIEFTIARKFPDGTKTESGFSPLAAPGNPFVFCWVLDKKRLWVASQEVTGYIDFSSLPAESPKESSSHSNLIHSSSSVPAKLVAEMPVAFRKAAAKWFRVAADNK